MKIYGKNAVSELIKSGKIRIKKVFLQMELKNNKDKFCYFR